jgi:signal transduction histidine kinase
MTKGSLRLRLFLAATAAIGLALAIAGFGLVVLFERHVERRIGTELDTYLNQLASRVVFNPDGAFELQGKLADPRFEKVFSGLYWQVTDETGNATSRSRSLWDTRLGLPIDTPPVGEIHVHDIVGPENSPLLIHERRLSYGTPSGRRLLRLATAIDRTEVDALIADFAWDVTLSLGLLAAVLLLAAWVQVNIGLKPLGEIRKGLSAIRDGRTERLNVEVPVEIAPLANQVNKLLEARDHAIVRARERAADLAHGFKTPLMALLADAKKLRAKGEAAIAEEVEHTVKTMRGHVDRELSRTRVRSSAEARPIRPAGAVASIIKTLKRTPKGEQILFDQAIADALRVRVDGDDFNELMGNLLENAVQHARETVRIHAKKNGPLVLFEVEDDGPGISTREIKQVLRRGDRLDRSPHGAGLGLAIVTDVLEHYGQELDLGPSNLGGLKARFELPA